METSRESISEDEMQNEAQIEASSTSETVSIIGTSLLQPIADLIDQALKHKVGSEEEVRAHYYDNTYSISVILLLVVMVESYMSRVRYLLMKSDVEKGKISGPTHLRIGKYFPDFENPEELAEIFVVRDVITHNHTWETQYDWATEELIHEIPFLDKENEPKYVAAVDPKTKRTRLLGLNVVPSRISRRDAVIVLDVVLKTLLFLENQGLQYCSMSCCNVIFRGKNRSFNEVVKALQGSLPIEIR